MGEAAEQRTDSLNEPVPFLMIVDCVGTSDDGMIPYAIVLEEVRQALSAQQGIEANLVHVSIRESREEILHAIRAADDGEDRHCG